MSSDPISKYNSQGTNYCSTVRHDTYPAIAIKPEERALDGRYVLITGASRGIGKATALSAARAGAAGVGLLARSSLSAVKAEVIGAAEAAGHKAPVVVTASADITSQPEMTAAAKTISDGLGGKLDILVLNAGTLETINKILEQDPDDWWFSYQTSVLGSFLTLQQYVPLLRNTPSGLGTVIAMGSIGATMAHPGISGTPTAKLALSKLMEHVNAEYGTAGDDNSTPLLAYSIHPGAIDHPERDDFPDILHELSVDTTELPADTVVWLAKERRQWLAGRFISANWDVEELSSKRAQIERRDLLKFRMAMGGEDPSQIVGH